MSEGKFTRSKYQADNADVYPIRVQPETLNLTINGVQNAAPTTQTTRDASAYARKGKRKYGVGARTVTLAWTDAVPTGYDPAGTLTVPVLLTETYTSYRVGQTGTYEGGNVQVIGKSPESVK